MKITLVQKWELFGTSLQTMAVDSFLYILNIFYKNISTAREI